MLGNPPWENVKLAEKEFFATRAPEIAELAGARRKAAIARLSVDDPALLNEYEAALRHAEAESHLMRSSGRFPLCGRGDVNTYAVFAEAMRDAVAPRGRLGVIVPTGIATDDTTKHFFAECVNRSQLVSLFDFENAERLFPGIATINRFSLLTLAGLDEQAFESEFAFFLHRVGDLDDVERRFNLNPADFMLLNPNTRTCPVFRNRRDADLTKTIYHGVPVLVDEARGDEGNPWGVSFMTMFHMASDSHLFRTAQELATEGAVLDANVWHEEEECWLPLYEAKMAHQYNHRDGDYAGYHMTAGREVRSLAGGTEDQLRDPHYVVQPRYWLPEHTVHSALGSPTPTWLLGFRGLTNTTTNRRTMVSFALPVSAVGHSTPLVSLTGPPERRALLMSVLNSFPADFVTRQKISGSNMTFFVVKQLAVLAPTQLDADAPWTVGSAASWLSPRVLELTYTAWAMKGFAEDLGFHGPPFRWDASRRELLRAELDAAFFHLYGLIEDDVDYVMETFPIVKRRDEERFGNYRTKELILDVYRRMRVAIETGVPYETILDPPPSDPRVAHEATPPALVGE